MRALTAGLALLAALPSAWAVPAPAAANVSVPSAHVAVSSGNGSRPVAAVERQLVNCRDPKTGINATCWETLNMTNWVRTWFSTHTCQEGEGFSNCFLRTNGLGATDCTVINPQSCGADITTHANAQSAEVFYVMYNIYSINNFFNSWWLATQLAASSAALKVDAIVQLLDPPETKNLILNDVLAALLAGLAFVPGPLDILVSSGLKVVQQVLVNSAMTTLTVAPGVLRTVFPTKTDNTQTVQIGQLKSQLGNLASGIANRLSPALKLAQSDLDSFVQLASTGTFSAHPPYQVDKQTEGLDRAFTTFLASVGLEGNGWNAAMAIDTNPQQLATNGTSLQYDIDCAGYDANNVCNAWWYDNKTDTAYTLNNQNHLKDNPYLRLHTIFSNGWSSGEMLFGGARACKEAGHYGSGVTFDVDHGKMDLGCLSQLQLCTYDKHCRGRKCEFTDCPSLSGFGPVSTRWGVAYWVVNAGYLGPMLTQKVVKVKNSGFTW